jgi:AGZA family xanthine/uracil permease-like MFS transporter
MANAMTAKAGPEKWWVPGDWNAFFGFGTNILVNVLVLTGLLRYVLKMPDSLVFGRILPALGLMLFLSTVYYAWLAYRLAQKTGRTDVCALPSGTSVPHMFVVTFVVMLPILLRTNDPVQAWEAGLTWVFVQSFVLMAGGFIAPIIRKITPRAALLGSSPAFRSPSFRCGPASWCLRRRSSAWCASPSSWRTGSAACAISGTCRAG